MNRLLALTCAAVVSLAASQATAQSAACATLNRIIAAADATPTWQGVVRGSAGTAVPAGFTACSTTEYSSSTDYVCSADHPAAALEARYADLLQLVRQCVPGEPTVTRDTISTSTRWTTSSGVEITATRVAQANANNFATGLTVRRPY